MDLMFKIKNNILNALNNSEKRSEFNFKESVYAFTNENIAGYLADLDIDHNTKVFSICSGGDHLLNLGVKGVLNIDLVDINPMSEFIALGIKLSLILMCTFEDYERVIQFLFKSRVYDLTLEKKILDALLDFMDLKYRRFFEEIFDYYFRLQERYQVPVKLMQILTKDYYYKIEEITSYNLFMQSEKSYNTLKNNIRKFNLSFKNGNIFDINMRSFYDLILCSNAIEYTYIPRCDINKLKYFYENLRRSLTSKGLIMATYIYGFYNGEYPNYPINGTDVTIREILKEELIKVDSYKDDKDAVLVLRK